MLTSTQATPSRPSLHVLAAGVNDYFDSRLALSYAVPDARALGAALTKAGRGLYEAVNVTYLLDEDVSAEGMAAAFDRLGETVRPHDVFVFFLAGHGKTHDGRYYFLPRDFRYRGEDALKDTAISQGQLQGWMAQVPAQKSVLLFDTCESGSLTEEAVTRGLEAQAAIERLARAVGRTTVTASTDTAPALEGYRGHGLFTYTLLEAFAMADHDADGAARGQRAHRPCGRASAGAVGGGVRLSPGAAVQQPRERVRAGPVGGGAVGDRRGHPEDADPRGDCRSRCAGTPRRRRFGAGDARGGGAGTGGGARGRLVAGGCGRGEARVAVGIEAAPDPVSAARVGMLPALRDHGGNDRWLHAH